MKLRQQRRLKYRMLGFDTGSLERKTTNLYILRKTTKSGCKSVEQRAAEDAAAQLEVAQAAMEAVVRREAEAREQGTKRKAVERSVTSVNLERTSTPRTRTCVADPARTIDSARPTP